MVLSSGQRSQIENILRKVHARGMTNYAVNWDGAIDEIESITENPETVPACPMLQRQGIKLSACHKVMIGEEECKDCYSDIEKIGGD